MAKKKITQLDPATSVNSDALFPLSQEDNNEEKTFKGTIEQLGDYINKSQDYNTLNTTSKKVIGAINEVLANSDKDIISSIDTPAPIMTFNDGGDNIPVNKLLVAVKAVQASGTPTPSSPLAISGRTQAVISVTNDTITTKWGMEQGTINSSGANQVATTRLRTINNTPIEASTTYNFKIGGSSSLELYRLFEYDANGGVTYSAPTGTSGSFTTASTTVAFRILIRFTDNSTITLADLESIQITKQQAKGTVVTTIPFGDTYYGGVLDVVNGKLTVTHGIVDMGDLTYTSAGDLRAVGKNTIQSVTGLNPKRTSTADAICSVDELTQTTNQIRFTTITTPEADMPTTYAGQKIVFELETPFEITLTPIQITTLSGVNNIYADCGDIQILEYFNENADEIAELHRSLSDDFHIYSTAEQIVGKWIDGKTLYEKTVAFTTANTSNYTQQNLGLLVSEVDTIFLQSGFVEKSGSITSWGGYASNVPADEAVGMLFRNATDLTFDYRVSSAYYSANASITVRYTKAS